jgi:hypothetical protein
MTDPFKLYGATGNAVAPIGQVPQAIGYPLAKVDESPAGGFDPTTDMIISRILDGVATDLVQEPTGVGDANAIQINFGSAVNTISDPVMLSAAGTVTINEAGTYRLKVSLQFGRIGASGVSELLFRVTVNGSQAGRSIVAFVNSANDTQHFENDTWLNVPANTVIAYEIMRDTAGSNFGGLYGYTPTEGWNVAPSAAIRVERWVSAP